MLEYITDDDGNLKGVVDFWVVNADGSFNAEGKYIWLNNVYIPPKYRSNGIIAEFIDRVGKKVPLAQYAYFHRRKNGEVKGIKMFSRRKWFRIAKRFKQEVNNGTAKD